MAESKYSDRHTITSNKKTSLLEVESRTSHMEPKIVSTPQDITEVIRKAQILANQDVPSEAQPLFLHALCQQEDRHGYYSDEVSQVYHLLGWFHYNSDNYSLALTYFLQSLRISYTLHGDEELCTQAIMDDVNDLLDDMRVDDTHINSIFDSWALQDEICDVSEEREDDNVLPPTYQEALENIPNEFDLERARVYVKMAEWGQMHSQHEQALGWYRQALRILPQYLSHDHPCVVAVTKRIQNMATMSKTRLQRSFSRRKHLPDRQPPFTASE